jgi:ketosteroid isomerase-like protein
VNARATDEHGIRDAIELWNRGDWEATLAYCDPEIEWRLAQPMFDLPVVSHGHDGVREFWRRWAEVWEEIHLEIERIVPLEDTVAALVRWRARGREGVEVDQQALFVFTMPDGLATHFVAYLQLDQVPAELGLATGG